MLRLYRLACTTGAYRETCPPPAQRHRTPPFSKLRRVARNVQSEVGRKTANLGRLHLTHNAVFRSIGQHTLPMWVSGHLCCLSGLPKELCTRARSSPVPTGTYLAPPAVALFLRFLLAAVVDTAPGDAGGRRANPSPHKQRRRRANVPQVAGSSKPSPPPDPSLDAEK